MSLLRSSGLAHLARITAAILARRSGFLIPAMNLLRSSGSAQRALVSARFRSRIAGSAQYSLVAVRCFSFTLDRRIRSRAWACVGDRRHLPMLYAGLFVRLFVSR